MGLAVLVVDVAVTAVAVLIPPVVVHGLARAVVVVDVAVAIVAVLISTVVMHGRRRAVLMVRVAIVAVAVLVLAVGVVRVPGVAVRVVRGATVVVRIRLAVRVVRVAVAAVAVVRVLVAPVVRVPLVRVRRPLECETLYIVVVAALRRLGFCELRFEPSLLSLQPRRAVGRHRLAQRVRDGRELRRDLQGVRRGVELGRHVGLQQRGGLGVLPGQALRVRQRERLPARQQDLRGPARDAGEGDQDPRGLQREEGPRERGRRRAGLAAQQEERLKWELLHLLCPAAAQQRWAHSG